MFRSKTPVLAAGAATLFASTSALAHHAMDAALPSTFAQGIVSGLAHPVIGLDHLAFIVAVGLVAGVARLGTWLPIVFVVASIVGVLVHLQDVDLPLVELMIGLSVLGIGALLAAARGILGRGVWIAVFATTGIFHGYAYGESIVGAEPAPLWAYLVGLALIQSAIGVGIAMLASRPAWTPVALAPRLAGAAVFGIGLTAFVGQIVPG